jgi:hypothetical protein
MIDRVVATHNIGKSVQMILQGGKLELLFRVAIRSVALLSLANLAGCGGGSMSARTPVGILVQATPNNQTAYSGQAPPQNQVSFAAYVNYSDGSVGSTPLSGAQWADTDNWVSLQGSVATCTQPAPVVILPFFSTITATAQVNGKTYTSNSGLYCF